MPKVVLSPIGNPENSSFVTELNAALDILADEFEKIIYRDGSFNLSGNVDFNSKRIYNLPYPASGTDPLRLVDAAALSGAPGTPGTNAVNPSYTYVINTLTPGSEGTLVASGTYPNVLLTFGIPRGTAGASGALGDGIYADITVSGTGTVLTVTAGSITLAKMASLASAGVIGKTAAGVPEILSFAGLKTAMAFVKADVGLGNVDNTSDVGKPVSTAQQTALDLKSNSASPTLTGTPLAPTAAVGTKTTQLATTAFVNTPSIQVVTSAAAVTPTFANDAVQITAQAVALDLANPIGTVQDMWGVVIRIKDNGTARAITYGTQYRNVGVTRPTTTVVNKTLYIGMIYNAADTKWDIVSVSQEA